MGAERKLLYFGAAGFATETQLDDTTTFGGLTMGGDVVMQDNKITGVGDATADGDVIGYQQTGAELGDLTITAAGDINVSGGGELVGLPAVPDGATSATSKAYVDSLVSGLGWVNPVICFRLMGNANIATTNGLSPEAGQAYVMTEAGDLTVNDPDLTVAVGDIVEFDGSEWVKLIDGSGGFVPAGTRAILSDEDTIISPYTDATDNDKIVVFSGSSNTATDTGDTANGAAVLIQDPSAVGYYDNLGYTYDGTVATGNWIQFTGAGQINAGDGLTKDGNTIDVVGGDGIVANADDVAVDLATNPGLQFTSNKLDLLLKSANELAKDASGLYIVGVPSLFQIGGTAVGATVTAANLDDLTDGSNADTLHVHTGTGVTMDHADLNNVTSDQHHAESHSIASHSDTTATGAELDTLTNGSDASSLHTHAGAGEAERIENTFTVGTGGVTVGDPVYFSADSTVAEALGTTDTAFGVIGVAKTTESAAGSVEVVTTGPLADSITGLSPTAGDLIYLAAGGGLTKTRPTGSGNRLVLVGVAIDGDDLFVSPQIVGQIR